MLLTKKEQKMQEKDKYFWNNVTFSDFWEVLRVSKNWMIIISFKDIPKKEKQNSHDLTKP